VKFREVILVNSDEHSGLADAKENASILTLREAQKADAKILVDSIYEILSDALVLLTQTGWKN
jgi:hypothetical protein